MYSQVIESFANHLLSAEKASLGRLQGELRNITTGLREAQQNLTRCHGDSREYAQRLKALAHRVQRTQDEVERLQDELNNLTPIAGEIENLEEHLRKEEEEKDFAENQFADIAAEIEKINEEQRKIREQQREITGQLADANAALSKAEVKLNRLKQKREDALRQKNKALEEVSRAAEERVELVAARDERAERIANLIEQATTICERVVVPNGETVDSLERSLQRMIQDRERTERELGGSEEDLLVKANEAKLVYFQAKRKAESIFQMIQALKNSLGERNERWHKFRRHIASRARITFGYLLSERNFRGQLRIDHASKHLEIHVSCLRAL